MRLHLYGWACSLLACGIAAINLEPHTDEASAQLLPAEMLAQDYSYHDGNFDIYMG